MKKIYLKNEKINKVSEYKSLPKKEREWFGLYQIPYSMEISSLNFVENKKEDNDEGWNGFYSYVKKEYPIQYFFREYLGDIIFYFWNAKIMSKYGETWHSKIWARLFNDRQKYLRKVIPYTWCDKPELFTEIVFAMLVNYVEGERCFEIIDFDHHESDKEIKKYIIESYDIIKIQIPKLKEQESRAYNNIKLRKVEAKNQDIQGMDLYNFIYKEVHDIENTIQQKEEFVLQGFLKHRQSLWT